MIGPLQLGCSNGHRFDANKRGFVNLLPMQRGAALGDTPAMLAARSTFLSAGHFAPIATAVHAALDPAPDRRIVDAGCGTGYYLEWVLRERSGWQALAVDASPAAVTISSRLVGCPGLVADTWQPLPIRDAAADAILCVFAPRNPAEFRRILADRGCAVVVTPRAEHLVELRDSGMLGIQPDKRSQLDAALLPHFELAGRQELEYSVHLSATDAGLAVSMGPAGHHGELSQAYSSATTVTVSVDVSVYRAT